MNCLTPLFLMLWLIVAASPASMGQGEDFQERDAQSLIGTSRVVLPVQNGVDVTATKQWLRQQVPALDAQKSSLELMHHQSSNVGYHLTFKQRYQGVTIFGSYVKVNVSKNGRLLSLFHKTLKPQDLSLSRSLLSTKRPDLPAFDGNTRQSWVLYKDEKAPRLALQVAVTNVHQGRYDQILYSRSGDTLLHRDMNRYLGLRSDTSAQAYVYLPNPLVTAKQDYGKPFWNNNDQTNKELRQQQERVTITVAHMQPDSFILQSPQIRIANFSAPTTAPVYSRTPVFRFNRDTPAFEAVNAYYHLNRFYGHMQDLGTEKMIDYQLPVDHQALSGRDNSQFSSQGATREGKLYFGTGGVDDAEDAEIVVHEYGHAISSFASPGSYTGTPESEALEEGLCDYLACSYARNLNSYNWERLFSWDAGARKGKRNEFWAGRWCTTDKTYPDDLTANKYASGEIWAGTFMEVWEELGRNVTDHLVLSALNSFSNSMTMRDGALLVLQADSLLYQAQHSSTLVRILNANGLVDKKNLGTVNPQADQSWKPTAGYQRGNFYINFQQPNANLTVTLTTLGGQVLQERQGNYQDQLQLPASGLASGVYLLRISTPHQSTALKVIKP